MAAPSSDVSQEVALLLLDAADELERAGFRRIARAHRGRALLLTSQDVRAPQA